MLTAQGRILIHRSKGSLLGGSVFSTDRNMLGVLGGIRGNKQAWLQRRVYVSGAPEPLTKEGSKASFLNMWSLRLTEAHCVKVPDVSGG